MKLIIKGGQLEVEIQGNPLETIQAQLQEAIQKQDEDIATMGSHVNESITMIHRINGMMAKQISEKSRQDIINLQEEVNSAILDLMDMNQNIPEIQALSEKVKKLTAITKSEDSRIKELKAKVGSMVKPKVITKTTTKIVKKPDENITKLHTTINNIKRIPVSKYPRSDWKVRKQIARAGVPVHSSDSDQIGKLNAVPRMPI